MAAGHNRPHPERASQGQLLSIAGAGRVPCAPGGDVAESAESMRLGAALAALARLRERLLAQRPCLAASRAR
jgi:hypothetical protein